MKHTKITIFLIAVTAFCVTIAGSAQDIDHQEVIFNSGDNSLKGNLVLPASDEKVPVLLFLGGIDEWGQIHDQRESFIQNNLLSVFPENGIAVFYYDPRGVGDSDGRWGRATIRDFADDAHSAIQFLKRRIDIDGERIGVIGLGEDGWTVQVLASEYPQDLKVMISLGGPTFTPERQLVNEYYSEYLCNDLNAVEALDKAELKALSHQNWVSALPLTKKWRHMKMKLDFKPAHHLQNITIPSLFLFGGNDPKVHSEWAMNAMNSTFNNTIPSNFTVHTIIGANHFFHITNPCLNYDKVDNIMLNYSFRFKELFQNWVFENL